MARPKPSLPVSFPLMTRFGALVLRVSLCALALPCFAANAWADSHEALRKAADLVQQGNLDEADKQAVIALSDPATHATACSVLGMIRLRQKRLPESITYLREAIRLEPHLIGAHLMLAEVYLTQGKTEPAFEVYRQVLKLDASNTEARMALARSEGEKGNYQQSLTLAYPALAALRKFPDGLYLLATDYLGIGDRNAAAALANDWARLPDVPEDWSVKFALLLARGGAVRESIQILEPLKKAGAPSFQLAFNLAGVYLLGHDFTRALDNYDLALQNDPKSLTALRQAAATAEQHDELERSLSYWVRARKIEPDDPEILLGFGRVCLKMDLLEDAEPALTRATEMRPDDPKYQYTLASAEVGKKQFIVAEKIFQQLVENTPRDPQYQYALGSVQYLEGHLADAGAHFAESIRLLPQQSASYYYLALIARDQGREAEAIEELRSLLRRYPNHALSCEALGELLMSTRQYSEAENNLQKAVRLNPKSVKANYQLGLLLSRTGRKEEADKQLEIAKSLRAEDEATSRLQLRLLDPEQ
jgi:tetratricopeptide (TPR) repeat protein